MEKLKRKELKLWELYEIEGGAAGGGGVAVVVNVKTGKIMPVPEKVIAKLLGAAKHGAPFKEECDERGVIPCPTENICEER